jgi:hypothetical protein
MIVISIIYDDTGTREEFQILRPTDLVKPIRIERKAAGATSGKRGREDRGQRQSYMYAASVRQ